MPQPIMQQNEVHWLTQKPYFFNSGSHEVQKILAAFILPHVLTNFSEIEKKIQDEIVPGYCVVEIRA